MLCAHLIVRWLAWVLNYDWLLIDLYQSKRLHLFLRGTQRLRLKVMWWCNFIRFPKNDAIQKKWVPLLKSYGYTGTISVNTLIVSISQNSSFILAWPKNLMLELFPVKPAEAPLLAHTYMHVFAWLLFQPRSPLPFSIDKCGQVYLFTLRFGKNWGGKRCLDRTNTILRFF